jgi:DNA-directed RNA polymerase-3 subunit RPC5
MTIKSAGWDGDEVVTETMADRLRAVQIEGWRIMRYVDEESDEAWEAYQESLLLRPDSATAEAVPEKQGGDHTGGHGTILGDRSAVEPKGKEVDIDMSGAADLAGMVTALKAQWSEEELLRAISGIRPDERRPSEETRAAESKTEGKGKAKEAGVKAEPKAQETRKRPGRPPKNAGTTAMSKRSSQGKAAIKGGSSANTMDID